MENKIKNYVKFKEKKIIIRPIEGEVGNVMVFELTDSINTKQYINYKGNKYQMISCSESKQK
jgi:hypothetical protein